MTAHYAHNVGTEVTSHWRGIVQGAIVVVGTVVIASCTVATDGICAALAFEVGGAELSGGALLAAAGIGAAEHSAEYAVSSGCHTFGGYAEQAGIGALLGVGEAGAEEFSPIGASPGAHAAPQSLVTAFLHFWTN